MNITAFLFALCSVATSASAVAAETSPMPAPAPGRKDGSVAASCIPMKSGNASRAASQGPSATSDPAVGRKRGASRADCDPATSPRRNATAAPADGQRVVRTFPGGTTVYADVRDGAVRGYSAVDARGRALKVSVSRNPPKGMIPGPGDTIVRSTLRAEEEHERWMAKMREQSAAGTGTIEKGCWIVVITGDPATGGVMYQNCPKG